MRVYGKVATGFWQDEKMLPLNDREKLLALYLLTGPHSNMLGCFRLPIGYISADLNWSPKTVQRSLAALARVGYLRRNEATGLTLLPNYFRYNMIENPNVGKRAAALIKGLPRDTDIMAELAAMLAPFADRLPTGLLQCLAAPAGNRPASPSAVARSDTPARQAAPPSSRAFADFWSKFPTTAPAGNARNRAAAAFDRVVASGRATAAELIDAARRYGETINETNEKAVDPATWLAVEHWRRIAPPTRKTKP